MAKRLKVQKIGEPLDVGRNETPGRAARLKNEKFAAYGFELMIPSDWRIEFDHKSTREKGDVAFQSQKGNRVFLTWGSLEDVKRFKTLEEHRDKSIDQVKKGTDVKKYSVSGLRETQVGGHRALVSHVSAQISTGMIGGRISGREVRSVHLHCPDLSRYYVLLCIERDPTEFGDMGQVFDSIMETMVCHPPSS